MIFEMRKTSAISELLLIFVSCKPCIKSDSDTNQANPQKKYQAKAPPTQTFGQEAFEDIDQQKLDG